MINNPPEWFVSAPALLLLSSCSPPAFAGVGQEEVWGRHRVDRERIKENKALRKFFKKAFRLSATLLII